MNLVEGLKNASTIENTKGGRYYQTTYSENLDLFAGISRYNDDETIINKFEKALKEDRQIALANVLYFLDIREGKGERKIFKICFEYLCHNDKESALKIMKFISDLGRWDYILVGIDTLIDKETVGVIKEQLNNDMKTETPSLLGKWLPSHRTHGVNNVVAAKLIRKLDMNERDYRKLLKSLRDKIKIVEHNLTEKDYKSIKYDQVPSKAMLKYRQAFYRNDLERMTEYMDKVDNKELKINTTNLFPYEIIRILYSKAFNNLLTDEELKLLDTMWNNQEDIYIGNDKNILVMADTSGSMLNYNYLPISNALGLATYFAERNRGYFKNHVITFSHNPKIIEVKGKNILEKVNSYGCEVAETNIDRAMDMLLNTAMEHDIDPNEMPSHLLIISDMEFDEGVKRGRTNFSNWKDKFAKSNYNIPKIIFWNVAGNTRGLPTTKFENDVVMISGFSTNIIKSLLDIESYNPIDSMMEILDKYIQMLEV